MMFACLYRIQRWIPCLVAKRAIPAAHPPVTRESSPRALAIEELEERAAPGVIWGT
jgi:hypothetical protein